MKSFSKNSEPWRNASQILGRAADIIKENGWHQGEETAEVRIQCVASATEKAFSELGGGMVEFSYIVDALNRQLAGSTSQSHPTKKEDIHGAPAVPYWGLSFMSWNDAKGRTQDEAVAFLRGASQISSSS